MCQNTSHSGRATSVFLPVLFPLARTVAPALPQLRAGSGQGWCWVLAKQRGSSLVITTAVVAGPAPCIGASMGCSRALLSPCWLNSSLHTYGLSYKYPLAPGLCGFQVKSITLDSGDSLPCCSRGCRGCKWTLMASALCSGSGIDFKDGMRRKKPALRSHRCTRIVCSPSGHFSCEGF